MTLARALLVLVACIACRHEIVTAPPAFVSEPEPEPAAGQAIDAATVVDDPNALPPIEVQIEVTTAISSAEPDPKTQQLVVIARAGTNEGVQASWIGEIVNERRERVGDFTIRTVQARTTTGTTSLTRDQLAGAFVHLTAP